MLRAGLHRSGLLLNSTSSLRIHSHTTEPPTPPTTLPPTHTFCLNYIPSPPTSGHVHLCPASSLTLVRPRSNTVPTEAETICTTLRYLAQSPPRLRSLIRCASERRSPPYLYACWRSIARSFIILYSRGLRFRLLLLLTARRHLSQ